MILHFTLNGTKREIEVDPTAKLIDVLRDMGCVSVKKGCGEGNCGACTVLVDGKPLMSCIMLVGQVEGCSVETVESLGSVEHTHPLQQALVDHAGIQCGFCTPGMLLSAKALLDRNPNPTEAEVRRAIDGNLCRCTGYVKIVEGILDGAARMRGEKGEAK